MVLFNYSTRELTAKIVYYGPGLCGKTTNLQYIYDTLPDNIKKGKMLSLATKTDRTLFFDFLPLDLGKIRGMKTRVQLYTVPGQVFYNSTRKLVLKGADGVVFVADSQSKMLEANVESYKNLEDNLLEMGLHLEELPLVMQFNKRDLPNLASVEEMNTQINRHNAPFYEAVATSGIGVEDTLKAITKLVLNNLAAKYKLEGAPAPAEAARAGPAPPQHALSPPPTAATQSKPVPAPARPIERTTQTLQEDLALERLDVEGPAAIRPPAPARAGAPRLAAPVPQEIFELEEEIDPPGSEEPRDGSVDLGGDLLKELEEEHEQVSAPAGARAGAAPRTSAAPLRQVPSPGDREAEDPIDLEAPLDLDEDWDPSGGAGAVSVASGHIDIGPLTPGQEREIDLPVTATVDGRPVRLSLRVTVRLSS
jgi:signal recognition particle receptor subunit beta